MSFKPVRYDSGKVMRLPMGGSAVATKFGHMKMSSGYLVAGAAGDDEAEYIALQTVTDVTTNDAGTYVEVIRIDDSIQFDATCSAEPSQASQVGNDYDFTSATVLNIAASTDKIFHVDSLINATDLIVRGHFNKPAVG